MTEQEHIHLQSINQDLHTNGLFSREYKKPNDKIKFCEISCCENELTKDNMSPLVGICDECYCRFNVDSNGIDY